MDLFPEFQADYELMYSHLKASLTKILDDHYAESAHKFFALSQSGRITSIREQTTDKEWTKLTTYKPVRNSQRVSPVSSQLEMALSNPAAIININMSYPSGEFNWSPDQVSFGHEIDQQISSYLPSKITSIGTEKDIINLIEELKLIQQSQQEQLSLIEDKQNLTLSEIRYCQLLLEKKFDKPEKEPSKLKEKNNLLKSFLCNEQSEGDEVKQSANEDSLYSGYILTNEDNDHASDTNSTEESIQVDDDSPAVPTNPFVSVSNGDSLNNSGLDSSLLQILKSSSSSKHQSELINESASNVSPVSSSLSINSDDIHHEFHVNDDSDDLKTCPREESRKDILSTNADANEHMDFGHGHNQIYLSSSSISKFGNPILDLLNDDCKVSQEPDDKFSSNEARSSTLYDADLDFAPGTLSSLDDNHVEQNESNAQMSASQIASSASPFEELNKRILESPEIEYDKTNNDQNEELLLFNEDCEVMVSQHEKNVSLITPIKVSTTSQTNGNGRQLFSPIAADNNSPDIMDRINDDDIMWSTSNKPIIDCQHSRTILSPSPINESITSSTGGTAPRTSVLNCQEPLPNNDDSIIKLDDNANEHQASNKNSLLPNQSCVNYICSPVTSNLIVTFSGDHDNDSAKLNTSIERTVFDEQNQDVRESSLIIEDASFVSNDSLDSPVSMKINGNDHRGKLHVAVLTSTPSTDGNESRLSSVSNTSNDSVIFIEEVKPEVRIADSYVQSPLPFKCPKGCLIKLKTTNQLRNHLKKVHKLNHYPCSFLNCNASFEHAHLLQRHKDECHSMESQKYQCLGCSELFYSKWDYDEHLKGCNGMNDICRYATNNKNEQKRNSQKASNKRLKVKSKNQRLM